MAPSFTQIAITSLQSNADKRSIGNNNMKNRVTAVSASTLAFFASIAGAQEEDSNLGEVVATVDCRFGAK
jgi:hypothetical protein